MSELKYKLLQTKLKKREGVTDQYNVVEIYHESITNTDDRHSKLAIKNLKFRNSCTGCPTNIVIKKEIEDMCHRYVMSQDM